MSAKLAALLVACALPAAPALAQNPKNCQEVAMYLSGPGDFVIEPKPGVVFTVYCHYAATPDGYLIPREYLTLVNTGGGFNFGQYTAGGISSGTDVRTSFAKVRIDPITLTVDLGDTTFATSIGSLMHGGSIQVTQMPLGTAMDCYGNGSLLGVANIDLTGTPFGINASFSASGWGVGLVTFNGQDVTLPQVRLGVDSSVLVKNTQSVTVHGGGACGSSGPVGFGSNVWEAIVPGSKLALQLEYVGTSP